MSSHSIQPLNSVLGHSVNNNYNYGNNRRPIYNSPRQLRRASRRRPRRSGGNGISNINDSLSQNGRNYGNNNKINGKLYVYVVQQKGGKMRRGKHSNLSKRYNVSPLRLIFIF